MPSPNGISELFDQINKLTLRWNLQRNNNRSRIFVHYPIDPARPIRPFDHILTNASPGVPINLTATDRLDRHATSHANQVRYFLSTLAQFGTENSRCDGYFSDP